MNETIRVSRVVVGVDGSQASLAAVRYGASEALRTSALLELVHVLPGTMPLASPTAMLYPLTLAESRRIGGRILAVARRVATAILRDDRFIQERLTEGERVPSLVAASAGARALILGDQRLSLADRIFTGSVVAGVATRAKAPVTVVPEHWLTGTPKGVVAVGVQDCAISHGLVRRALAAAADRDAALVVVHAWELPNLYDDMIVSRIDSEAWEKDSRAALDALVTAVSGSLPPVKVEVRLIHGQPASALRDVSGEADLLLLARRPHAFPLGYLGGTGRALLRETLCPVEILPPAAEPVWSEDAEIERDGALLPATQA